MISISIPMNHREKERRHRVRAFTSVITSLISRIAVILMATQAPPAEVARADWNDAETTALLAYLTAHRSEGEGTNFKMQTYNAAAEKTAPFWTNGPAKTGKMCKTKWQSVC